MRPRGGRHCPCRGPTTIKFAGTGENSISLNSLFRSGLARILGMGDVVSLVEKAAEPSSEDASSLTQTRRSFDFMISLAQFKMMRPHGPGDISWHVTGE